MDAIGIIKNSHLKDKKCHKSRDNCHFKGEYRGAAYSICNLKYFVPKTIPIVVHNEYIYDYNISQMS